MDVDRQDADNELKQKQNKAAPAEGAVEAAPSDPEEIQLITKKKYNEAKGKDKEL